MYTVLPVKHLHNLLLIYRNITRVGSPEEMLNESISLAKSDINPNVWIHSAAVLDYSMNPVDGKVPSGREKWNIELQPTLKHIPELSKFIGESIRFGFKLETSVSEEELIEKSLNQISEYGVDYVIANILNRSMTLIYQEQDWFLEMGVSKFY